MLPMPKHNGPWFLSLSSGFGRWAYKLYRRWYDHRKLQKLHAFNGSNKMIIAVGGTSNKAGKTLFCKFLHSYLGNKSFQYLSTSECLIKELSEKIKVPEKEIKLNKDFYRQDLIDLTKGDPTHAIMSSFLEWDQKRNIIFESIRRKEEFGILEKQKDVVFIYVYCSDATLLQRNAVREDVNEVRDLFMPMGEPARNVYLVRNDGDPSDLKSRAKHIADMIKAGVL